MNRWPSYHVIDFLDCLPKCCCLEARSEHLGHDIIELRAVVKVMAPDDGRGRQGFRWEEHLLCTNEVRVS